MKWTKERDLLIAQTLAFVQSVTGKKADAGKPQSRAEFEGEPFGAAKVAIEIISPTRVAEPTEQTAASPTAASLVSNAPAPIPRGASTGEFRAEIQGRVATFRAHQQRLSREREEYCSATMARIHAAIQDDSAHLPLRK